MYADYISPTISNRINYLKPTAKAVLYLINPPGSLIFTTGSDCNGVLRAQKTIPGAVRPSSSSLCTVITARLTVKTVSQVVGTPRMHAAVRKNLRKKLRPDRQCIQRLKSVFAWRNDRFPLITDGERFKSVRPVASG